MAMTPIPQQDAEKYREQLTKQFTKVMLHHAFFAPAQMKLDFMLTLDVPTAGVDGRTCFINPPWFFGMNDGEQLFVLLHEYLHCMLLHMFRRGAREAIPFNIAGDAIINALLQEYATQVPARVAPIMPSIGVNLPQYKDWDIVAVYNDLMKDAKWIRVKKSGKGEPLDDVMAPADGAGADDGEEGDEDGAGGDGRQTLEGEWQDVLINSAQMAKAVGRLPGVFASLIEDFIRPNQRWEDILLRYAVDRHPEETSWSRINRRFVGMGAYLPGLDGQRLKKVIFSLDCSGSISDTEARLGVGGVNEVMEAMHPEELFLVQWDTKVQHVARYTPEDMPLQTVEIHGRGGTDINDFFNWVKENHADVDFVITMTDGCLSFPPNPGFDVVWMLTRPAQPGYGLCLDVRV
jgi:predicted metal-dependent peptidase